MMVLYSGTTCPFSQRCRFALFEKGMDFEIRDVDLYNKQAETVDWGGEVDYSGYEWFKDPPPRPAVSSRLGPVSNMLADTALAAATTTTYHRQLRPSAGRDRTE